MKLEFTEQQLRVLDAALAEMPYKTSAPLIQHINQQIHSYRALEFDERREKSKNHQNEKK